MALKAKDFYREGTPFELFQIGNEYSEIKVHVALFLKQIHADLRKKGIINSLCKYENKIMSENILFILIDLEIINRLTISENIVQYKWTCGNDPDFIELTNRVVKELNLS